MLNRAARRFRGKIADGRLSLPPHSPTLSLPEASVDGAITINTIYFIADLNRAFSELARTLKASRRAVIGLADPEWMSKLPTTGYGFRLRPVSEVMDAAAHAGLIVDEDRRVSQIPTRTTYSLSALHRAFPRRRRFAAGARLPRVVTMARWLA